MRSYELYFTFYTKSTDVKYNVRVFRQPWHRYAIASVYHWYDMQIFKVPGFRQLERWLLNRHYKRHGYGDWSYLPISCRQDIKCHFLGELDKEVLATFEIDRPTYLLLGGPESTPENNN